ncbi:MAG: site-2 protease family protein [Planctomycetes bacterium]|nr:site-2 protease family protein [Planctomycetota bacterium]
MLMEPAQTRFDLKWTLFKVACRVHPFFWLTGVMLAFGMRKAELILIYILCVFVSILVHEYGHALTARRYGARQVRIVLYGLGGLAISEARLTRRQRVFMTLWGPGAGFVLAVATVAFAGLVYGVDDTLLAARTSVGLSGSTNEILDAVARMGRIPFVALGFMFSINLIWGLLNLLPIYPLDGGQLAREWFTMKRGEKGIYDSLRFSMWFCGVLAVFFFVFALYERFGYGERDPNLIPPVFFGFMAYVNYSLSTPRFLEAQQDQHRENNTPRQPWEQDADWWKGGS